MYSSIAEWVYYFENIVDYLETGDEATYCGSRAYRTINQHLEALGYAVPIGTYTDGDYDQILKDWESIWACYYLVQRRHRAQFAEEPAWLTALWLEGTAIEKELKDGKTVLRQDVSPSESGIGKPSAYSANLGSAIFYNNWDGYGTGTLGNIYQGTDYRRTFVVEVTGTGTGTTRTIPEGTYRWSNDNGLSWIATAQVCGSVWIGLGSEVWIRWECGGTGSINQIYIGNKWTFDCSPKWMLVAGNAQQDYREREYLIR